MSVSRRFETFKASPLRSRCGWPDVKTKWLPIMIQLISRLELHVLGYWSDHSDCGSQDQTIPVEMLAGGTLGAL